MCDPMKTRYLSIKETAGCFDVSPDTVRRMCVEGEIRGALRLRGCWRIPLGAVEASCSVAHAQR